MIKILPYRQRSKNFVKKKKKIGHSFRLAIEYRETRLTQITLKDFDFKNTPFKSDLFETLSLVTKQPIRYLFASKSHSSRTMNVIEV